MSVNLAAHYVMQYSTNLALLLQQKESRLRASVSSGSHVGKQASPLDQFGPVAAKKVSGRFQPKERTDAPVDRRWVVPVDYDLEQKIDSFDKLKMISDPKSIYVQNTMAAFNRAMDDEIISGIFDANKTGEVGASSTVFDTNQVVAVTTGATAATGMNVAKLKAARKLFRKREVDLDMEQLYCTISAEQEEDLLNEIQVVSLDFNTKPVLTDGKLMSFLGFNFIHTERLPVDGSGYRRCVAYVKSGIYLGMWQDVVNDAYQDKTLRGHPWTLYSMASFGATRLEEKRLVEIKCAE